MQGEALAVLVSQQAPSAGKRSSGPACCTSPILLCVADILGADFEALEEDPLYLVLDKLHPHRSVIEAADSDPSPNGRNRGVRYRDRVAKGAECPPW